MILTASPIACIPTSSTHAAHYIGSAECTMTSCTLHISVERARLHLDYMPHLESNPVSHFAITHESFTGFGTTCGPL